MGCEDYRRSCGVDVGFSLARYVIGLRGRQMPSRFAQGDIKFGEGGRRAPFDRLRMAERGVQDGGARGAGWRSECLRMAE